MDPLSLLLGILPKIFMALDKRADAKAAKDKETVIGPAGLNGLPAEGLSRGDLLTKHGVHVSEDVFAKLDTNGDKKLSMDELWKADKNGDRLLSRGELSSIR